jgi:hypothetical protein
MESDLNKPVYLLNTHQQQPYTRQEESKHQYKISAGQPRFIKEKNPCTGDQEEAHHKQIDECEFYVFHQVISQA